MPFRPALRIETEAGPALRQGELHGAYHQRRDGGRGLRSSTGILDEEACLVSIQLSPTVFWLPLDQSGGCTQEELTAHLIEQMMKRIRQNSAES
jgi:hypothetical protein